MRIANYIPPSEEAVIREIGAEYRDAFREFREAYEKYLWWESLRWLATYLAAFLLALLMFFVWSVWGMPLNLHQGTRLLIALPATGILAGGSVAIGYLCKMFLWARRAAQAEAHLQDVIWRPENRCLRQMVTRYNRSHRQPLLFVAGG